jgi:DNA-binding CsgD family transcriptional regulator
VSTSRSRRAEPPPAPLIDEADAVNEASETAPLLYTSLVLAAWRGDEARTLELVGATIQDASASGRREARSRAEYAQALLYNGLSRYDEALAAGMRGCGEEDLDVSVWALAELVEAGARSGRRDLAVAALRRLEERACAGGSDRELEVLARSEGLLSPSEEADVLYRRSLGRHAHGRSALHHARAQILYGEWLRRQGRRVDARIQLRAALETFTHVGAAGFADRARRELLATGETVRKRSAETRDDLTPQELEIARLAGSGYTNPEIGAKLFLSPRTVEWHLHKVFAKLGIASRTQLRGGVRAPIFTAAGSPG